MDFVQLDYNGIPLHNCMGVPMLKDAERQNEIERDEASRFAAAQYVSNGYYLHFHRNLEIYGVVKGRVVVTIAGQQQILTDGQIAIVDGLEDHCYEIEDKAEVAIITVSSVIVDIASSIDIPPATAALRADG